MMGISFELRMNRTQMTQMKLIYADYVNNRTQKKGKKG